MDLDAQIIHGQDGRPAFAVIPYEDYAELRQMFDVPNEVKRLANCRGLTYVATWRLYRGWTQEKMAEKVGLSLHRYQRLEQSHASHYSLLHKIADALKITVFQLHEREVVKSNGRKSEDTVPRSPPEPSGQGPGGDIAQGTE